MRLEQYLAVTDLAQVKHKHEEESPAKHGARKTEIDGVN